ncbi:MAG: hypothetical protein AABZ12_07940 [Planctomycetota bacterium]
MRRTVLTVGSTLLLALGAAGCIMVLGGVGYADCKTGHKHVVAIDGELYVVDTKAQTAKRLDPAAEDHETTISTTTTETKVNGG